MKIQIISDIHLEFGERGFDFSGCDLLILAGDIHVGTNAVEWIKRNTNNIPVIYILGNHEYYKHSYPKLIHKLKEAAKGSNIHVLENESVVFEDITFHCATLWTDFELFGNPQLAGLVCQQKMNDYNYIRRDPEYSRLRSIDTHVMHKESLRWLDNSLQSSNTAKNIVVTHHAPSIQSIPLQYRSSLLSAGFASNLEDFILKHEPDLWAHGHLHDAFDYNIGKTRIICNPYGYPGEKAQGFKDKLIVEMGSNETVA